MVMKARETTLCTSDDGNLRCLHGNSLVFAVKWSRAGKACEADDTTIWPRLELG